MTRNKTRNIGTLNRKDLRGIPEEALDNYVNFHEKHPLLSRYEEEIGKVLDSWGGPAIALSSMAIVDAVRAGMMPVEAALRMRVLYLEKALVDYVRDVATHPDGPKVYGLAALRAALKLPLQEAMDMYARFEKGVPRAQEPQSSPVDPNVIWREEMKAWTRGFAELEKRVDKLEALAMPAPAPAPKPLPRPRRTIDRTGTKRTVK